MVIENFGKLKEFLELFLVTEKYFRRNFFLKYNNKNTLNFPKFHRESLKGAVSPVSLISRWQCLIHNGTHKPLTDQGCRTYSH